MEWKENDGFGRRYGLKESGIDGLIFFPTLLIIPKIFCRRKKPKLATLYLLKAIEDQDAIIHWQLAFLMDILVGLIVLTLWVEILLGGY